MNKNKFTLVLFSLITIFQSCHLDGKYDCPKQQTFYQYLGITTTSNIPYNGFDTLTFVRTSVGDTFTFYGNGFTSGFIERSITRDPNCYDDLSRCEFKEVKFTSPKFPYPITYTMHIRNYNESPSMLINFQNQDFWGIYSVILSGPFKYDSLKLGSTMYKDIYYLTDPDNFNTSKFYLLYNKLGILKLKLPSNETWELVSK